jgi:hypothetical protein
MPDQFVSVEVVSGRTDAEILESYLRAQGVRCELSGEAAGWVHGLTVGPIAEVEILVPSHQRKKAADLIRLFRGTGPRRKG